MGIDGIWTTYAGALAVGLAVAAGVWSVTTRQELRPWLAPEHVAGAALLGFFGWEVLVSLPGAVAEYRVASAGLGDVPGLLGRQVFLVAQAAFGFGAALAVFGILRRRTWGAVLGIGLALSIVAVSALRVATYTSIAQSMGSNGYWALVVPTVALRATPALATAALLLWPLMRPSVRTA